MALLRRLEKRVHVPYPTQQARSLILRRTLPNERLDVNSDLEHVASLTEGYSGSDLVLVAKEAAMKPLRRLLTSLDLDAPRGSGPGGHQMRAPKPGPITPDDLASALAGTKPSVATYADRYAKWEQEFGSV